MSTLEKKPLVSVIMAVHQKHAYLEDAINSILFQSYQNLEFIIVANACPKELEDFLFSFKDSRIRIFITPIGQLSFNLNYGICFAQGEYIARMDSDDLSKVDRLEKQLEYFLKNQLLDVLGTQAQFINGNGVKSGITKLPLENENIRRQMFLKTSIYHPTVMYKKSTILKFKGYLGGLFCEDLGLWARMARDQNVVFGNLAETLLEYRIHENQSKGNSIAYSEVSGLIWTEFLLNPSFWMLYNFFVSIVKNIKLKLNNIES